MFVTLGDLTFGVSNVHEGPVGAEETLDNTINAHEVVRGKKPLQDAGEDNDQRSFSFFFDETFCDPGAQYAALKQARSSRSIMPLSVGTSYSGSHYVVTGVKITHRKHGRNGQPVRLEGSVDLIEVPSNSLSSAGFGGIAVAGLAVLNPLLRRG